MSRTFFQIVLITTITTFSVSATCPVECTCTPEILEDDDATSRLLKIECLWPHIPGASLFSTFPHRSVYKLIIDCKSDFPRSRYVSSMFASFNALRHLEIRNCYSEGNDLPSGFLNGLTKLKTLDLRAIAVQGHKLHLNLGSFVGSPALERLSLTHSNLADVPGNSLCHFKDMKMLNLSNNIIRNLKSIGFGANADCENQLVSLDLSNNRVSQLDNRALRGMNFLHILHLRNNGIDAIEKGTFVGLPRIQELHLGQNNLSRVDDLPPAVQILDLSENRLRSLPNDVRHHPNLVKLNISGNSLFDGDSRPTLKFGSQLTVLDLSRNRLRRVAASIFENASYLQQLHLGENGIDELEGNAFKNVPRLRYLDLSNNDVHRIQKDHFDGLQNLSELILDENIISVIADDAFAATPQLRRLSLSSNLLSNAPTALSLLFYLQRLDLSNNRIASIPKFLFDKLPNLKDLGLASNQIRSIDRYVFEKLPSLTSLDLSNNKIDRLATNCFEGTAAVKMLRLDCNAITDIQGNFVGLPQLQSLNLSSNRIAYIDFAMLPIGLRTLHASNNSITRVSNVLLHRRPSQLAVLDLSKNKITQLAPDTLPNSIEVANFNENNIARVDEGAVSEKSNLSSLDLSHNKIDELPSQAVANKKPYKLALIGNPLKCSCQNEWIQTAWHQGPNHKPKPRSKVLPHISDQNELNCISPWSNSNQEPIPFMAAKSDDFLCGYNEFCAEGCVCCEFESCDCNNVCPEGCRCFHDGKFARNIVKCEKSFQSIGIRQKIPMHATRIDLSRTAIDELQSNSFFAREKLEQLFLNRSNIRVIAKNAFNGLKTLEVLDLSFNRIEDLSGEEFNNLPKLQRLSLNDNRLQSISETLFERLPALKEIELHNNRLIVLSTAVINFSPTLSSISLSGNPWKCDCDPNRYAFQKWLPENTIIVPDYQSIYCADSVVSEGRTNQSIFNTTNATAALSILPVMAIGQTVVKVNFWTFVNGINITFCRPPSGNGGDSPSKGFENATIKSLIDDNSQNIRIMIICIALSALVVITLLIAVVWKFQNVACCKYSKYSTTASSSTANSSSRTTATTPIPLLQFDAFVSYSEKEESFVVNEIVNRLEQEYPYYSLCLLYRDLPTSSRTDCHRIDDGIIKMMEKSQRVITVLTRHFVEQEWTSTHLRTAYQCLMKEKHRKPTIVVIVDDLLLNEIDPTLAHYLRMNRCLHWSDPMFWQRFMDAMPERSVQHESALTNSSHYSDIYGTIVPSRFV